MVTNGKVDDMRLEDRIRDLADDLRCIGDENPIIADDMQQAIDKLDETLGHLRAGNEKLLARFGR